ncbi:hypothetical protein [Paraburkholderia sp. BL27I4N3]|uniref:hypothetical protein n=1 Tax=Paraburkholderia sp. BL27I4N3 TaxID=1938805 RepID=UPI000E22767B|nr:hypothetical protein [Paraburkholderia sp. BL27I4N3]
MPVSVLERASLEYLAGSVQSEMLYEDNASPIGMLCNIRLNVPSGILGSPGAEDVVWGLKFLGEDENFAWAQR